MQESGRVQLCREHCKWSGPARDRWRSLPPTPSKVIDQDEEKQPRGAQARRPSLWCKHWGRACLEQATTGHAFQQWRECESDPFIAAAAPSDFITEQLAGDWQLLSAS